MRKLAFMAALAAVALIVYIVESLIPLPIAVPGAKLGLANAVTLFALFFGRDDGKLSVEGRAAAIPVLTVGDAFMVLLARIILGALVTGRIIAFVYSIAGGLLGFSAQALVRRFVTNKQIWACGAVGAVFHNIGQIGAAIIVTGTPAIAAYLPVLIIIGVVTGVVTGLAAQFIIARLEGK